VASQKHTNNWTLTGLGPILTPLAGFNSLAALSRLRSIPTQAGFHSVSARLWFRSETRQGWWFHVMEVRM
jgi:hypothetical protein